MRGRRAQEWRRNTGLRAPGLPAIPSRNSHCAPTGSTGNVIAALVSFFIPGLGQLIQGRVLAALGFFVLSGALWFFLLGWIGHILATIDAAVWKPKS